MHQLAIPPVGVCSSRNNESSRDCSHCVVFSTILVVSFLRNSFCKSFKDIFNYYFKLKNTTQQTRHTTWNSLRVFLHEICGKSLIIILTMLGWIVHRKSSFETLTPAQNGGHYTCDILKCIFFIENGCIFIMISLKCVWKGNIEKVVYLCSWLIGSKEATSHCLKQ